ncbi:MAG: hypothetical protein GY769_01985 [bacterium]|nr:hypothetical protein [bacterium]
MGSWVQPGFHRFWRVWNPLYGYFLYRLYLVLGGNRHRLVATLTVFASCGFVLHDLLVFLFSGYFSLVCTFGFVFFAILSLLSARFQKLLRQGEWPAAANAAANIGAIIVGLIGGVWANNILLG